MKKLLLIGLVVLLNCTYDVNNCIINEKNINIVEEDTSIIKDYYIISRCFNTFGPDGKSNIKFKVDKKIYDSYNINDNFLLEEK